MYSTEIKIGEREIPIKFGFMTIRTLQKNRVISPDNPEGVNWIDAIFELIKAGAMTAARTTEPVLDDFDVADWIDESGGIESDAVNNVLNLFVKSQGDGVPKNSQAVSPKKTTPQKK